jgi:Uncharacterized membrane-associated protein
MGSFEHWLVQVLTDYGLLAVFVTMILESACIPIPSEVVVPYGGFLAAQGHVALWQVVLVATSANLIGSSLAYAAGRYGGRRLLLRYGRYVFISAHHLDQADRWFEKRGELTVFVTRMMPGVRTFISVPAGVGRMPFGRFAVYTFLGALPWNVALASVGYVFGANWDRLQHYFSRFNTVIWALLALVLIALVVWKWRDIRASRTGAADQED